MISIVDYGVGNLRSVEKAFESLGFEVETTSDIDKICRSNAIVVPGVGAFPDAMENLRERGLDKILVECSKNKVPMLGICLGMQLFFDLGYEVRECPGLGLIKGKIEKIQGEVKIPHMGWNSLNVNRPCQLLKGIKEGSYVYFVHSFYAEVENEENINAIAEYGMSIPAVVSSGNTFGIQFHPEKSGAVGLQILKNFGELIK